MGLILAQSSRLDIAFSMEDQGFTVAHFLEVADAYLSKAKKDFGTEVSLCLPLSPSEFGRTTHSKKMAMNAYSG